MILTDKTKKDFGLWHFENGNYFEYINFHNLSDNLRNAIIIEWFDSVGIIINVKRYVMPLGEVEWYFIITGDNGAHLNNHVSQESRSILDCRKNITTQAIKKSKRDIQ